MILKEMHELRSAVQSAKGKNIDAHIRAGVAMLYAHWEDFVKGAANAYVSYLSFRGDRMCDLKPCFVALGMKSIMLSTQTSAQSAIAVATVSYLIDELNRPIKLPAVEAISAQSNLNSDVFTNIVGWIGIVPAKYSTRFTLIDKTLLGTRNGIAHGEYLVIDTPRFDSLVEEVLDLLRWFKTDIENAAVQKSFLRA
ncbi:MAE_28990/MAE_18760 family HEPN-like nuclease [Noviherbaspirillum sedimenti]|uniref:MAE_28990/MAE_18760 family HEPN-like nuclease n=1 Tax=Noviherbaspirillum sedimenti TaxID=2320865 RepID=UPI0011C456CF|nr:MAE_28990/MAE_18760 family HEPN-like nuclease [Noviherbaspirillum sedimenti]